MVNYPNHINTSDIVFLQWQENLIYNSGILMSVQNTYRYPLGCIV